MTENFNKEMFKTLAELEESNFWFKSRNKLILYLLSRYFPGFSSFLEAGCGTGFVLRGVHDAFPGRRLVGVELFEEGLAQARKRLPDLELSRMDIVGLPFKNEFDVIGSFDVLEHIKEDQKVLDNFHEALKPGGGLLIAVPQHQSLWSKTDEAAGHVRRYSNKELLSKMHKSGFTVLRSLSFVSLLFPVMYLSRRVLRRSGNDEQELNLPAWQNRLLEAVMNLELSLIKLGLNFPFGGSRVVVARRN